VQGSAVGLISRLVERLNLVEVITSPFNVLRMRVVFFPDSASKGLIPPSPIPDPSYLADLNISKVGLDEDPGSDYRTSLDLDITGCLRSTFFPQAAVVRIANFSSHEF